jgi:hypothetical protein
MFWNFSFIHQNDQSIDWEYGPYLTTNDHKLMNLTNNLHIGIGQYQVVILVIAHVLAICWTENMPFGKA